MNSTDLDIILGKHKKWLLGIDGGERANLSYADLRGANLSYANLSYADLSHSDLRGANLSYANLSYADLSHSDLRGADLSQSDLSYANLSYADLRGADLSQSDLSYTNLSYAELSDDYHGLVVAHNKMLKENAHLGVQESEEAEIVPLTLGQLREMDGQPVWIVEYPDWGHWELSEDAEDYVSDRVPEFYGMRYNDPDGKYGLHKLGWLAYAHPHAKIDPGVRQYKEYREAIKKMKQEREYFWKCIDHMHSRPPIWRVRAYIKWRKAGAEL